jgi:hypothetical protein
VTTAPAETTATTTPGPDTRPGPVTLTRTQKILGGVVIAGVTVIAGIGFAGSYHSVTALAEAKGFGWFAQYFTIGVDSGIGVLLALDLLLTWLRIPFPLLRQTAWLLTGATIVFNAAAAWPDPIGVGMHAVIPLLFVISVEAARHAIGRIADITADKHIESPPISRWIVALPSTFRIWRRMRKHNIRSYEEVIEHQRQIHVYRARLRNEYGRGWRTKAPAEKLLVLRLAAGGMTVEDAIALPELEAERRRQAQFEQTEAERAAERNRVAEAAESRRLEAEESAERRRREEEEDRVRRLAEAQTEAQIADIQREQKAAQEADAAAAWQREQDRLREQAEQDQIRRQEQLNHENALAAIAQQKADAEAKAREEAERTRKEKERLALIEAAARTSQVRGTTNANSRTSEPAATGTSANRATNSGTANSRTVNSGTTNPANREPATAAANPRTANPANLNDRAATKRNQIENVLNLIDELGYDATTLGIVMERTGMTKTTAYHRLTEARGAWNQRQAS